MSAKVSSRSRQSSDATVRSHWSRPSTKRQTTSKTTEEEDVDGKPAGEEGRKRRTKHRKTSLSDSRRLHKTRTRSQSSKTDSQKSRKSHQSKSSSRSAEKHGRRTNAEEHVHIIEAKSSKARSRSPSPKPSSRRRRSSPAALEVEVTPDDSISQVGLKPRSSRPETKRRSTHSKLARITEDDDDAPGYATPPRPAKKHSIFDTLFGRRRKDDDVTGEERARSDRSQRESRRSMSYMDDIDARARHRRDEEDLTTRMRLADLNDHNKDFLARKHADVETWGLGNAAGHFMNDDFVRQNASRLAMSSFGDAKMGRRGERASGRRAQPKVVREVDDSGLAPNFLGDQSVVGFGAFAPRTSRHPR
ncbi:uncharacterized protein RCC_01676 [Ramularia collo-cygni]|uniref:Uncharacterized protein n=1 Tax=Ramularia collo-cygni TaxID=112498 RepID=A0A2D3USX9_9PEZI|nr:uncharacterized protein RCC_01676 [Ramularia collo-cygni]CZT15840.1 uncharacterized protein RCC_01676 [Ramularia collo-cygni]